jgi:glycosyl transferase family 25
MKPLHAYVINLDRAPERWAHIERSFAKKNFSLIRVPAIDGKNLTLPSADFDAKGFERFHGRVLNIFELACSLSHLKALRAFLASNEDHAMICEDDIFFDDQLEAILSGALNYSSSWNILRLTGLSNAGLATPVQKLIGDYSLCVEFGRLKGGAAYLIDRKAAAIFLQKLLPMWLPWDHAFDREWFFRLRALSIRPFPISQTDEKFSSAIQKNSQPKLSRWKRYLTTYPYQAFNEVSRWLFRFWALLCWKVGR